METGPCVIQEEGSSLTSLSLLERAKANEQAAWARLLSLYSPLVERWCRLAHVRPADADDIRQEVFLAVAQHLAAFHRDRAGDTFRGWLHTITRRKIVSHWRKAKGEVVGAGGDDAQEMFLETPAPEPAVLDDRVDWQEIQLLLRQAMELVRPNYEEKTWQAFMQTAINGRCAADVAAELHMSTNAVYLARSHILTRLREEFADLIDVQPCS